ncbi:MAG TPA: Mpo1-like protein [Rhodanobacteraceae bacterium]|nr:Mpo1-like protein [Rhodanobacteraceae bacterium]
MRDINDWFGGYSRDHQNPTNRAIHWVCVPAILWSVVAMLWVVPVPAWLGRNGLWAALAMFLAFLFYQRLSRNIGLAMAAVFSAAALLSEGLFRWLGGSGLLWLAVAVFVLAWIGQFIGHALEQQRPSFLTDLAYLLIGPAWLAGKLLRRLHINW